MTDKELLTALTEIQAEAYLQRLPFAAGVVKKLRDRLEHLSNENDRLKAAQWLIDSVEQNLKNTQDKA